MWTLAFWKATAERATSTAAQSALLVIGADQFSIISVSWLEVGGFAAGGAVLAALKSLVAAGIGNGSPSLTSAERLTTTYADPR